MKKVVPVTLTLLEFLQLLDQCEVHPVKIYSSPKKDDYLILTLEFFHLAKFNRDQKIAAAVGSELLSAHIKTIGLETNNALESMYTVVLDNTQARKGKS